MYYNDYRYNSQEQNVTKERRERGLGPNVIVASIEEAYVPYGSNNLYMMPRTNLFYVVNSENLQITTELRVSYTNEEKAISPFCVVESRDTSKLKAIYAIELQIGGIYKFSVIEGEYDSGY